MHTTPSSALPVGRGLLYVTLAATAWGTAGAAAALLYRGSGLGPLALTFWRTLGGLVLLLAIRALLSRRSSAAAVPAPYEPLGRRVTRIAVTGVALAVFQAAYFAAVETTGLAVGTVITGARPHRHRCTRDDGRATRRGRRPGRRRGAGRADGADHRR